MLIKKGEYHKSQLYPNFNWLNDTYFIIDETTTEGKQMAKTYIENYPFVDFEYDGKFATRVIILEEDKLVEHQRIEQEKLEKELIKNLKPSEKEVLMAEIELNTINLLQEIGVI